MKKEQLDFANTGYFGNLFLDFIGEKNELKPFYNSVGNIDLEQYKIDLAKRDTLVKVIEDQAKIINLSSKSNFNLNLLKEENTLTLTTGHQLNLMGGPLFFIYKILSTIRACEEYAKQFPAFNFVPIYWMASEDHDFAEINHFYLFGKKYEWQKTCENQCVGELDLSGLKEILETCTEISAEIKDCYLSSKTLKEAHYKLVNHLFGNYGLLILDANDSRLKQGFLEFTNKEINTQVTYNQVISTNEKLTKLNYKPQVTPRECNLFYQENGKRYRVEVAGERVNLVGANQSFSKMEFLTKIEQNPALISQNVLTRTIYQQQILPNIAYIGGPGELAYWLQLKSLFDSQNMAFPLLIPRFSALYLPKFLLEKMQKASFETSQLFTPFEQLKNEILSSDTEGTLLSQSIDNQFNTYKNGLLDSLKNQPNLSLISFTESALTRMEKEHENISKRIKKEIEARNSIKIERSKSILDSVFPNGELQERTESVFTFAINKPDFIEKVYHAINPFEYQFTILSDD
jgi:bacillithiol synthase